MSPQYPGSDLKLQLDAKQLSPQKNVVRIFYDELWNKADTTVIPSIIHEDFTFRGSLGPDLKGREEFASYVRWVTSTLSSYTCDVFELIEQDNKVAAKLCFHGFQEKPMFGCPPTGKHVWWYATPIFTFESGKIKELWIIGDVYGLINRLKSKDTDIEFDPSTH